MPPVYTHLLKRKTEEKIVMSLIGEIGKWIFEMQIFGSLRGHIVVHSNIFAVATLIKQS